MNADIQEQGKLFLEIRDSNGKLIIREEIPDPIKLLRGEILEISLVLPEQSHVGNTRTNI